MVLGLSVSEVEDLTLWQYTAAVEEHNIRSNVDEVAVEAPTSEDYQRDLEILRERGDPSIQV